MIEFTWPKDIRLVARMGEDTNTALSFQENFMCNYKTFIVKKVQA